MQIWVSDGVAGGHQHCGWCRSRETPPLDGQDGHAKLEVKLRVAFPQPDLNVENFGDEGNVWHVGMGELEIDVDRMNYV